MIFSCNAWGALCLSICKCISENKALASALVCLQTHSHVCTLWMITQLYVSKWHPWASPVSYFPAEYICMWACICCFCAGIYACLCVKTHPGSGSSYNKEEILAHADIIMLPLVLSSCLVWCEPTYVGSGRHLLLSLQIWAWWDWHHHNPNSHAQGSAGSAQTRSSQFTMTLRCLALVIDFQAGSSLACFWGSGPDAVCWKMAESYLETDGREPWQGSASWAPRAGWPQFPGTQLSCLVACTHLHESVPDLGPGRKVQRGRMFAEKHATLIMGLELIIGRI